MKKTKNKKKEGEEDGARGGRYISDSLSFFKS